MRFPAIYAQNKNNDTINIHFHPVNCTKKDWAEFWNGYLKSEFTKTLKYFVYRVRISNKHLNLLK